MTDLVDRLRALDDRGYTPHTGAIGAGAGGFDSRSLAEIVVKDGVRVPDEAQAFSEFCTG